MSHDAKTQNQMRPQGRPAERHVDQVTAPATPAPAPAVSAEEDLVGYLRSKGWKPLGNPAWPTCLWRDPTKPLKAYYTKQPILVANEDGKMEHLMVPDGLGKTRPGERHVFHPAGTPVLIHEAIQTQMERDLEEQAATA